MAEQILQYEARRDGSGRLVVYDLPAGDGGGDYEVAGINEKYHPVEAAELRALIKAGKHAEAEARAQEIIATYTDAAAKWHDDPGVQFFLRDSVFNRGPTGAMRILQRAVQVKDDGKWGPITRAAVEAMTPVQLLSRLRVARENYERVVVGRNESSQFWKGLVNRWDNALAAAGKFHSEADQGEVA
jgi:lysozyme family protein